MVRLRKHVHRLDMSDGEAVPGEGEEVAKEGRRITGDIDKIPAGERRKFGGQLRHTLPGGIEDDAIEDPAFARESPAGVVDRAFLEGRIGKTCLGAVLPGASDGGGLSFDTEKRGGPAGDGDGKVSHAAEQVEDGIACVRKPQS